MKKLKKASFSLILKTKFAKKVNRTIFRNFWKKNKKKNAMMFVKKCRIIQCFNCYKYEHIDKKYKNVMKCNQRAKKHKTNRCNKNEIKIIYRCINCEQTKYQIGMRMCLIK